MPQDSTDQSNKGRLNPKKRNVPTVVTANRWRVDGDNRSKYAQECGRWKEITRSQENYKSIEFQHVREIN